MQGMQAQLLQLIEYLVIWFPILKVQGNSLFATQFTQNKSDHQNRKQKSLHSTVGVWGWRSFSQAVWNTFVTDSASSLALKGSDKSKDLRASLVLSTKVSIILFLILTFTVQKCAYLQSSVPSKLNCLTIDNTSLKHCLKFFSSAKILTILREHSWTSSYQTLFQPEKLERLANAISIHLSTKIFEVIF